MRWDQITGHLENGPDEFEHVAAIKILFGPAGYVSDDATGFRRELQALVWKCLQELHPRYREVLVLRDYQDLSYADIATTLKIPRGTVMSRLHRARRLLQEEVRKHRSDTGEARDG